MRDLQPLSPCNQWYLIVFNMPLTVPSGLEWTEVSYADILALMLAQAPCAG